MEDSVIMKPLWEQFQIYINPFVPKALFFYHLTFFWCFPGVEKGCIENKWVKYLQSDQCPYSHLNLTECEENFGTNLLKFAQILQNKTPL